MKRDLVTAALVLCMAGWAQANLITNASFETVPNSNTGQGMLPSDWTLIHPPTPGADTYSNDGSYGVFPTAYGNFTGVTAHDGIRWVAGWSEAGQESFGQHLASNLTANKDYTMSGWLHQAVRSDLNNPGAYDIYMSGTPGTQDYLLGTLGPTAPVASGWQQYSFNFTATDAMAALDFLEFAPVRAGAGLRGAYPGLDLVSLEQTVVPVPGAALLGFIGMAMSAHVLSRRRRKTA